MEYAKNSDLGDDPCHKIGGVMFNGEQGKREMAYIITRYAYRDTALEDYHSKSIVMDMLFYKRIYNIVFSKLKK